MWLGRPASSVRLGRIERYKSDSSGWHSPNSELGVHASFVFQPKCLSSSISFSGCFSFLLLTWFHYCPFSQQLHTSVFCTFCGPNHLSIPSSPPAALQLSFLCVEKTLATSFLLPRHLQHFRHFSDQSNEPAFLVHSPPDCLKYVFSFGFTLWRALAFCSDVLHSMSLMPFFSLCLVYPRSP